MENNKRDYVSEKEYVLYLPKNSGEPEGFISVNDKCEMNLKDRIADATRLTSVEANRYAMSYSASTKRFPFKLKICNYKDLVF